MALTDHALDRFRVINGLGPHDAVKPGTKVKIVVDSSASPSLRCPLKARLEGRRLQFIARHPSRLATLAPQDDGSVLARLIIDGELRRHIGTPEIDEFSGL